MNATMPSSFTEVVGEDHPTDVRIMRATRYVTDPTDWIAPGQRTVDDVQIQDFRAAALPQLSS